MKSILKQTQPYWAIEYDIPEGKAFSRRKSPVNKVITIKTATVENMINKLDALGDVVSLLPGNIGKKISGIKFHNTSRDVSSLDITFDKLSIAEAGYPCFNQSGRTFRLWLGWYGWYGVQKHYYSVFEGATHEVSYAYGPDGISATIKLLSRAGSKAYNLPPNTDITNILCSWDNMKRGKEVYPVFTVAQLLVSICNFIDCRDVNVVFAVENNSDAAREQILELLGLKTDPDSLKTASDFYFNFRAYLYAGGKQTIGGGIKTIYKNQSYSPVQILDELAGYLSCNWWISPMSVLFFGIPPLPFKKETVKVFRYRPFPRGLPTDISEPDAFENFEMLETLTLPSIAQTYIISKEVDGFGLDYELKRMLNSGEMDATVDYSETIALSDEEVEATRLKLESEKKLEMKDSYTDPTKEEILRTKQSIVETKAQEYRALQNKIELAKGYNPVVMIDSNLFSYVEARGKCRTSNTVTSQLIGKISGAQGDPIVEVGDTIFFRGANRHSGFYFVNEVLHTIDKGGGYKMDIIATLPKKQTGDIDPSILIDGDFIAKELQTKWETSEGRLIKTEKWADQKIWHLQELQVIHTETRKHFKEKEKKWKKTLEGYGQA